MIRDLKQLATFADFKKVAATAAKSIGKNPVKVLYFPKFPFGKESKPAMFIGDMAPAILSEVKKRGGAATAGTCQVNVDKLEFNITGGSFNAKAFKDFLSPLGVALPIVDKAAPAPDKPEAPKPLQTKELGSAYKDEDKKVGWRSEDPKTSASDFRTTKYFNEQEKAASKVTMDSKGRMVDAAGKVIANADKGFVMSPKGEVHQFEQNQLLNTPDGKQKTVHHSSPLAGGKVAGAGTIQTGPKGQVTKITDQSGHYKPGADLTHQVVRELGKEKDVEGFSKNLVDRRPDASGAPVNRPAKVELLGKNGLTKEEWDANHKDVSKINKLLKEKMGAKAFQLTQQQLDTMTLPGINMSIGKGTAVTLTTQQFEQTQGNEDQIRRKAQVMDQLTKKVPPKPPTSQSRPADIHATYDDVSDVSGPAPKKPQVNARPAGSSYSTVPAPKTPAPKAPAAQTTYDVVEGFSGPAPKKPQVNARPAASSYNTVPAAKAPAAKTTYDDVPDVRDSAPQSKNTYDDVNDALDS